MRMWILILVLAICSAYAESFKEGPPKPVPGFSELEWAYDFPNLKIYDKTGGEILSVAKAEFIKKAGEYSVAHKMSPEAEKGVRKILTLCKAANGKLELETFQSILLGTYKPKNRDARLVLDLDFGSPLPYLGQDKASQRAARAAAANYMLHSVSWEQKTAPIDPEVAKKQADGKISFDTAGILTPEQLSAIRDANPYDCSPDKNGPIPLDWLVSYLSDYHNYYSLLGFSDPAERRVQRELEERLGVSFDLSKPTWKKALYKGSESRITVHRRATLVSESSKLAAPVWLTIDQDLNKVAESKNPFALIPDSANEAKAAGEIIATLPNGMPFYALITHDGRDLTFVEKAPSNLVRNNFPTLGAWKAKHFPSGQGANPDSIEVSHHCATCHRAGLVGPQRGLSLSGEALVDHLRGLAKKADSPIREELEKEAKALRELTEEEYSKGVQKNADELGKTLVALKAFIPDPKDKDIPAPIVADLKRRHEAKVPPEEAAAHFGVDKLTYQVALSRLRTRETSPNIYSDVSYPVSRYELEQKYCALKLELNSLKEAVKHGKKLTPEDIHSPPAVFK